jgi:hypothetical protein
MGELRTTAAMTSVAMGLRAVTAVEHYPGMPYGIFPQYA